MSEIREIHIDWDGPHTVEEVRQTLDGKTDRGVYQFYGHHSVYGNDTMLYIGKADGCSFSERMAEHRNHAVRFDKHWTPDANNMHIYVGRLTGKCTPRNRVWSKQIDMAERLLIFAHSPAWNSQELNLNIKRDNEWCNLFDVHVFNWGAHKSLLPEVSGRRYARDYPADENYLIYGDAPRCMRPPRPPRS